MPIPNLIDPALLSPAERLAELGQILAQGLISLHARKSTPLSPDRGDSCLDFVPHQRGHAGEPLRRKAP
jgi:hypothetical protein